MGNLCTKMPSQVNAIGEPLHKDAEQDAEPAGEAASGISPASSTPNGAGQDVLAAERERKTKTTMSPRRSGAALCVALVAVLVYHAFGTESNIHLVLRMNSLEDAVPVLAKLNVQDWEKLRELKDADVDKMMEEKKYDVKTGRQLKMKMPTLLSELGAIEHHTKLCDAAAAGDTQKVESLLAAGVPPDGLFLLKYKDKVSHKDAAGGWPALLYASQKGHTAVVQKLLDKGANVAFQDKVSQKLVPSWVM